MKSNDFRLLLETLNFQYNGNDGYTGTMKVVYKSGDIYKLEFQTNSTLPSIDIDSSVINGRYSYSQNVSFKIPFVNVQEEDAQTVFKLTKLED